MPDYGPREEERGNRMAQLINDPLLQDAFAKVEEKAIKSWRDGKTPAEREQAHARLTAVEWIKQEMTAVVDHGEIAKRMRNRIR